MPIDQTKTQIFDRSHLKVTTATQDKIFKSYNNYTDMVNIITDCRDIIDSLDRDLTGWELSTIDRINELLSKLNN